ncbi:hypothetical protein CLV28_2084 [Sediminihabitans luteus]|uniref:Uncharacterized protein n=1 Tax=Sediminihabitans luteus TaxID=1138585 RepID=A0A2M9CED0_9CELL|nr:hypothetical protein [Sediminihabitans luteus]PJJ70253.1 hypothetical protein CLV28_2084 [Sediminihabitans luteus]GII97724.1 hypothetical protein Slu03_01020 [Sediminihabitans luteus]
MIFFGWGRNALTAQVNDTQAVVLRYWYVHVFWLFRLSFPSGYGLATLTENGWATRDMEPHEKALAQREKHVRIHWWWRWGLLIGLAALVLFGSL